MKTLADILLAAIAITFLPSCAHDDRVTRTATTEETVVRQPRWITATETHESRVIRN